MTQTHPSWFVIARLQNSLRGVTTTRVARDSSLLIDWLAQHDEEACACCGVITRRDVMSDVDVPLVGLCCPACCEEFMLDFEDNKDDSCCAGGCCRNCLPDA